MSYRDLTDAEKRTLELHGKWRRGEPGGIRANLRGANLGDANLRGANLRGANLGDADLGGANLGGANLGDADLRGANLRDAYLRGANLGDADLGDANLGDANLGGANLGDANLGDANLGGANLGDADLGGANLRGAYLGGANLRDAYLGGANLRGANLGDADLGDARNVTTEQIASAAVAPIGDAQKQPNRPTPEPWRRRTPEELLQRFRARHPEVPIIENLDRKILDILEARPDALDMGSWHAEEENGQPHSCQTTHCRAGWAVTLAGEAGVELEKKHGPPRAGMMIYMASTGRVPHFYASTADAMEDIRRCAAQQAPDAEREGR